MRAWDLIERRFPELIGDDVSPFAAWGATDVDNSIVNAAGRHHVPDTFLQWIVATADRVASGFERETFEAYNQAEDKTRTGRNHYTARQLTLFEPIRLNGDPGNTRDQWHWRYPLKPLSPESLFPVEAKGYEGNDDKAAQAEYAALWEQFTAALDSIPSSHRGNWPLWLDHFDAAWGCFTHAIPAATAFNVRPEVSLYDHSRTAAAVAAALWRYHHESGDTGEDARKRLADRGRSDWDVEKLLLIQGDLLGIQDFIFATGGETQKRAAKLLRGRSFYIALLTECAALRILDALEPPTSQVINAAGKSLIVAPNTDRTRERLEQVQRSFDQWFLEHAYGQSGIGIAFRAACCNDFVTRESLEDPPFRVLIRGLFEDLQTAKSQRLDLCGERPPAPIFTDFLDRFRAEMGVCAIDGRSPMTRIDQICGEIELLSGLHIGSGNTEMHIGGTDNPVIKNPVTNEPYIPGSSLKGKMRSLLEWRDGFVGVVSEAENGKGRPLAFRHIPHIETEFVVRAKVILKLFGGAPESNPTAEMDALMTEVGPTRLAFWDCPLDPSWILEMRELNQLLLRFLWVGA
ncbi:type III-A CRISPR-associated protein Cas10/Csm1 [Thiocapsa sp.]|uniref:type III-A CRISPR-associated protein Cas10/Csm1 n=1 Tax=Thiocapsa sp. TaxID=2024551 RepID=UPI0035942023